MNDKITQKDIDWLLNLNSTSDNIKPLTSPQKKKQYLLRFLAAIAILLGLIILPFFVLIRVSAYFSLVQGLNEWLSISVGIVATILLLCFYLLMLFRNAKNPVFIARYSLAGVSALVLAFCIYGTFYLSAVHAKSDEVRSLYRSLHPVLRIAVTTTTLADGDLVITDIQRTAEDYQTMGLPTNHRSLHFEQADGFVHAIDLRTKGRWAIRNFLLRSSFELMGFQTIRHVGTADHLHVALPRKKH